MPQKLPWHQLRGATLFYCICIILPLSHLVAAAAPSTPSSSFTHIYDVAKDDLKIGPQAQAVHDADTALEELLQAQIKESTLTDKEMNTILHDNTGALYSVRFLELSGSDNANRKQDMILFATMRHYLTRTTAKQSLRILNARLHSHTRSNVHTEKSRELHIQALSTSNEKEFHQLFQSAFALRSAKK